METLDLGDFDAIVVGGGPGGFGAAVAASRNGARTLLVEREGFLGGAATSMLVNPFMRRQTRTGVPGAGGRVVNAGIYGEVVARMLERGAMDASDARFHDFDDEALKNVLDEMASEAGVRVLLHAALFEAPTEGRRVVAVRLAHNAGPARAGARVFLDGTGDGLLAAAAGCEFLLGDEDGAVMPMTTMFAVAGVDASRMPDRHRLAEMAASGGGDTPALECPRCGLVRVAPNGLAYFNAIRVPGRPLDPLDLGRAEAEGRRLVGNYVAWLRANVPGFESAALAKTGARIGVRETRRVVGDATITDTDARAFRAFDDAVAVGAYDFDIHGQRTDGTGGVLAPLPPGKVLQVPYGAIVPRDADNVLIAGRSLSAERLPYSSLRVMPVVMCIGQAAGTAAAMSLPGGEVRSVDAGELRHRLVEQGAVVS